MVRITGIVHSVISITLNLDKRKKDAATGAS